MNGFGEAIKRWRKFRDLSQLDLSLSANISCKHVSFLETGRSQPSREMVMVLCNSLGVPLAERNILLNLAGYADAYRRMDIEQEEMKAARDALRTMLDNHAPYPALVFDWQGNIIMMNEPFNKMLKFLCSAQANFLQTNNLLEMIFDPNGFRQFMENWPEVASVIMQHIQKEQLLRKDRNFNLLEKVKRYPGIPKDWNTYSPGETAQPMVPMVFKLADIRLKLFATIASFGTALDLTMRELIVEQYFPLDEISKRFFEKV